MTEDVERGISTHRAAEGDVEGIIRPQPRHFLPAASAVARLPQPSIEAQDEPDPGADEVNRADRDPPRQLQLLPGLAAVGRHEQHLRAVDEECAADTIEVVEASPRDAFALDP